MDDLSIPRRLHRLGPSYLDLIGLYPRLSVGWRGHIEPNRLSDGRSVPVNETNLNLLGVGVTVNGKRFDLNSLTGTVSVDLLNGPLTGNLTVKVTVWVTITRPLRWSAEFSAQYNSQGPIGDNEPPDCQL